jgi:hypothetical protein
MINEGNVNIEQWWNYNERREIKGLGESSVSMPLSPP